MVKKEKKLSFEENLKELENIVEQLESGEVDLENSVMLYEKGREHGALETILLRNGIVFECTSSNLFIVKDNIIKK